MAPVALLMTIACVAGVTACASSNKPVPRTPLRLAAGVSTAALSATQTGSAAYDRGDFAQARVSFEEAVKEAPQSGEAHYNLGLALYALGESGHARQEFIQAANLAPGHRVIWDSPALRPYGSPESSMAKSAAPPPGGGAGGRGGLGGLGGLGGMGRGGSPR